MPVTTCPTCRATVPPGPVPAACPACGTAFGPVPSPLPADPEPLVIDESALPGRPAVAPRRPAPPPAPVRRSVVRVRGTGPGPGRVLTATGFFVEPGVVVVSRNGLLAGAAPAVMPTGFEVVVSPGTPAARPSRPGCTGPTRPATWPC